jgi:hypothetical protein
MNTPAVPEGYRKNARGLLAHESTIKPIDKTRDELVHDIVQRARAVNALVADFKLHAFADIAAFVELSAEQYHIKVGGTKGNVSLISFDGSLKVVRSIAEYITFDERLIAAKALIDDCVRDWTHGARKELVVLINDAFRVDHAGKIRTTNVLGLARLEIEDERWQNAMLAIRESLQVIGSKSYIRIYERVGDTDEWKLLSTDIAGVV